MKNTIIRNLILLCGLCAFASDTYAQPSTTGPVYFTGAAPSPIDLYRGQMRIDTVGTDSIWIWHGDRSSGQYNYFDPQANAFADSCRIVQDSIFTCWKDGVEVVEDTIRFEIPVDAYEQWNTATINIADGLNKKSWFAFGTVDQIATVNTSQYQINDVLYIGKFAASTSGNLTIGAGGVVQFRNGLDFSTSLVLERGQTAIIKKINDNFWHVVNVYPEEKVYQVGADSCYTEFIDAPLAGSAFTLDNTTGGPSNAGVTFGTSQIFHAPDRQIFFNLDELPTGARIKSVSMYDERRGNNTAAVFFRYNGIPTNLISPATHANGFSAAPRTATFATSLLVQEGVPLIIVDPSQNHWDYAQGAGSPWIQSITPGTATASGGANDGVTTSLTGFNATVTFELSQGGTYTVRKYSDGTRTATLEDGTTIDVTAAIPATWTACVDTPEGVSSDIENRLVNGSDGKAYLGPECQDTTITYVTGPTSNPGNTPPSGILLGSITVNKTQNITVTHTGTGFTGSAGAGFGISDETIFATANSIAFSNIYSSSGNRIDAGTPSITYTDITLTPGTYQLGVWSGGLSGVTSHTLEVSYCQPEVDIDWVKEECYNLPSNNYEFTSNAPVTSNNGDMLQSTGAVAPSTAPFRLSNAGLEPIQINTIRIRAGAVGWVTLPAGNLTIGGVQYTATAYEDINATANDYRTIVFTPNNTPLVVESGQSFNSNGNWGLMTGGFQGPVPSASGSNPPFNPSLTQARAEVEYVVGTALPGDEVTVRTYEDGSLKLVDKTANTLTDLAVIDPTWTPCDETDNDVQYVETLCYQDAGTPFVLDQDPFADEINSSQLATLPAGAHMRWQDPNGNDVILDQLEINGFNGDVSISWQSSTGVTGSQTVTFSGGVNPRILELDQIYLPYPETIDFTLDAISSGQMQLTTAATSIANGWTALQDYSAFANTSHWATRLIGSENVVDAEVNVYQDTSGAKTYKQVEGGSLIDYTGDPSLLTECEIPIDTIKSFAYNVTEDSLVLEDTRNRYAVPILTKKITSVDCYEKTAGYDNLNGTATSTENISSAQLTTYSNDIDRPLVFLTLFINNPDPSTIPITATLDDLDTGAQVNSNTVSVPTGTGFYTFTWPSGTVLTNNNGEGYDIFFILGIGGVTSPQISYSNDGNLVDGNLVSANNSGQAPLAAWGTGEVEKVQLFTTEDDQTYYREDNTVIESPDISTWTACPDLPVDNTGVQDDYILVWDTDKYVAQPMTSTNAEVIATTSIFDLEYTLGTSSQHIKADPATTAALLVIIDAATYPDGYIHTIENGSNFDFVVDLASGDFIDHNRGIGFSEAQMTLAPGETAVIVKQSNLDHTVINRRKVSPVVTGTGDASITPFGVTSADGKWNLSFGNISNAWRPRLTNQSGATIGVTLHYFIQAGFATYPRKYQSNAMAAGAIDTATNGLNWTPGATFGDVQMKATWQDSDGDFYEGLILRSSQLNSSNPIFVKIEKLN